MSLTCTQHFTNMSLASPWYVWNWYPWYSWYSWPVTILMYYHCDYITICKLFCDLISDLLAISRGAFAPKNFWRHFTVNIWRCLPLGVVLILNILKLWRYFHFNILVRLPLEVVSHWNSSPTGGHLPSRVVFILNIFIVCFGHRSLSLKFGEDPTSCLWEISLQNLRSSSIGGRLHFEYFYSLVWSLKPHSQIWGRFDQW